jgi:hypothetical protein
VAAESGSRMGVVLVVIAVVLAVLAVIMRPFLFTPISVIVFLIGARATPSRTLTSPVASLIGVCFVVGAAIAVATNNPLY